MNQRKERKNYTAEEKVAVKMSIKLIHVEAGLRSFDRMMSAEINRIMTDSICAPFFCMTGEEKKNPLEKGANFIRTNDRRMTAIIKEKMNLCKLLFLLAALHGFEPR